MAGNAVGYLSFCFQILKVRMDGWTVKIMVPHPFVFMFVFGRWSLCFSAFVTLAFGLVEFRAYLKGCSFNKSTFLERSINLLTTREG